MVDNDDRVIGIISLSDLLTFLVLRPVGLERKEIPLAGALVSQNIKCCKVVEETAEEVALSDSQSSGGSSAADLTTQDRAQLGPDGLAGSLEEVEVNQLTTSSTGSSSATSSSSMLDGGLDGRSDDPSPATSTAKNLSNIMTSLAATSANQTLIAPLQ